MVELVCTDGRSNPISTVGVLHNDIKCNNILLSQSVSTPNESDQEILDDKHTRVHIVVIDFGMATFISRLRLTENELSYKICTYCS